MLLGDQLEELAELREGYAHASRNLRPDGDALSGALEPPPGMAARLSIIEASLRRSSEATKVSRRTSSAFPRLSAVDRAQVQPTPNAGLLTGVNTGLNPGELSAGRRTSGCSPAELSAPRAPRTNFQLLPQLTSRHLGVAADTRRRRMSNNPMSAPSGLQQDKAATVLQNAARKRKAKAATSAGSLLKTNSNKPSTSKKDAKPKEAKP